MAVALAPSPQGLAVVEIPPDLLTTTQAAERLGITSNAIIQAIRDGRLAARRSGLGKRPDWLVSVADLDAYRAGHPAGVKTDPRRRRRAVQPIEVEALPAVLSVAEAAAALGVSRQAVLKAIVRGDLTATRAGETRRDGYRIGRDDLAAYAADRAR